MGLSFVRFARLLGMEYIGLVDSHAEKRELARQFGADETFSRDDPDLSKLSRIANKGESPVEAVIDAVGKEEILNAAVKIIPEGGRVCVYGLYRKPRIELNADNAPRNWSLLYHQWPIRETEAEAQTQLIEWLRSGALTWQDFVSSRYPIRDVGSGIADIRSRKAVKILLEY